MKNWFYRNRYSLAALVVVTSTWLIISAVVPQQYLDILAYYALGWFFLGGVVMPWVEAKLENLFK